MIVLVIAVLVSIAALYVAQMLVARIKSSDPGTDRMKEIASYIEEGAMAFLGREYKILVIFVIAVFAALIFIVGISSTWMRGILTAVCFLVGALFSTATGYIGMRAATKANVRTANAARESGMNKALSIAFSGGSVMGLSVAGFGVLGLAALYIILKIVGIADQEIITIMTGFSLGASSIALFGRVGGGIYTKAADVGADLVGKVEAGIPEDDPRNPAVIADNVGDNVGDIAGMGSDLFESYVGSIVSAITLGIVATSKSGTAYGMNGVLYPMMVAIIGIVASIIAVMYVTGTLRGKRETKAPQKSLNMANYLSGAIVVVGSLIMSFAMLGNVSGFLAVLAGLVVGIAIGNITEIYTSDEHKHVQLIAEESQTGAATTIISGFSVGMRSTVGPVILIAIGVLISYSVAGLYGIALAAVGMLSTTGITVAVDAYGPIADNAGGIAEMADLPDEVREITDKLDSVGNTTAAIGKGFAIGSAALTALGLFASYTEAVGLIDVGIQITDPLVIAGLLIGSMLPFLFSAMTMSSVGKAANQMIEEVRRQFRTMEGLMEGLVKPDYNKCVDISTQAALREMVAPGLLAVIVPLVMGLLLGVEALGGLLVGSVMSGVMLALMMSNAGGAWDNAKKYIEAGAYGGKGSESHRAAVVGDTVGDPFKDTSGPSINILIKLMTIISLVCAPFIVQYGGLISNLLK